MKRLIMLAVLCAFVLGASIASAADVKISGSQIVDFRWKSNWAFKDEVSGQDQNNETTYDVKQRTNVVFQFVANENLKAVLYTRTEGNWGTDGGAFEVGATSSAIGVRRAYLDFNWPDTSINVKAGYLGLSLPYAIGGGSLIHDEETAALVVSGAFTDNVGYLLGYGRLFENGTSGESQVDAYIAALPVNFEGVSFTPFGMIANIGPDATIANGVNGRMAGLVAANATDSTTGGATFDGAYWLGAAFTMDLFDPFVFMADVNYGNLSSDIQANEMKGWMFDAALEYKGFDMMTPELFFAYTSGESGNATDGSDRMPITKAQSWALGSFFFGGDSLLIGSMADLTDNMGFWALGLSLKDIQSFADGLTHTATIMYVAGTNDEKLGDNKKTSGNVDNVTYGRTLTEEDYLVEVDFNTAYKIYDELTMTFDLGYINLNADENVWGTDLDGGDAWKVSTGLIYSF